MKNQPRYSKEEFARRGDAIYESELRPILENGNEGKFVALPHYSKEEFGRRGLSASSGVPHKG